MHYVVKWQFIYCFFAVVNFCCGKIPNSQYFYRIKVKNQILDNYILGFIFDILFHSIASHLFFKCVRVSLKIYGCKMFGGYMCTQKNVYKSTGFGGNFLGMG